MNTETINTEDTNQENTVVFQINERVIWNSSFGYEIGYFLGEGNQYHTYLIDEKSGLYPQLCSHSIDQIFKYSDEMVDVLTTTYGYEKRF